MAIISSYPVSTPQLADQVLGSNTFDATGTAVIGNPTVQYTFTSIKTLVDQQFIQQLVATSDSNATAPLIASQGPIVTNNIYTILFGAAQTPTLSTPLPTVISFALLPKSSLLKPWLTVGKN